MRPPEELRAGDLVVRRYDVDDARALHEAIVESIEHLRPWMSWIAFEPLSLADREVLIADRFAKGWDDGTDFGYGMFRGDRVVGGCGLHRRIADDGLEIGYWVRVGEIGRGVATTTAGALTDAALAIDGITHVEIHHDKANVRSARVPEKLGYALLGERADEIQAPAELGIECVWRIGAAR